MSDANGTTLYSWNARNQLTGISGPSVNASFVYDGAGRRQKKTINGNLTEFLYDGANPVQESSGATVLANMLTGLRIDEFFARTDVGAGSTSNLLTDPLGSTIALADASGAIQTEHTYEPFGKTIATGPSSNAFQYTGRENDGTGLYYYRARYYHPGLQQFISEDPIEFEGGDINLHAYVGNNPINFTDPTGEFWIPLCKALCGKIKELGRVLTILRQLIRRPQVPNKQKPPSHYERPPPKRWEDQSGVVPPIPPKNDPPTDQPPGENPPGCGRKDCPPPPPPPPPPGDDDCPWDGTRCGPPAS